MVFSLIFMLLFFLEGLHRTRWLVISIAGIIFLCAVSLPLVSKMPYSVQRSLSILPIKVDPVARADAQDSSRWRVEMWKIVSSQIPQYFWKGKGYAIDPTDLYLTELRGLYGLAGPSEGAILAGDYHSGPLSLIIPFGIFGVIGFVWFMVAGLHALYCNYRYGDPGLRRINAFLLVYFSTKAIFFFLVYGSLHSDLFAFVGLLGLSISLNGGVKKPAARTQFQPETANLAVA
jgi:hypothetical protein